MGKTSKLESLGQAVRVDSSQQGSATWQAGSKPTGHAHSWFLKFSRESLPMRCWWELHPFPSQAAWSRSARVRPMGCRTDSLESLGEALGTGKSPKGPAIWHQACSLQQLATPSLSFCPYTS